LLARRRILIVGVVIALLALSLLFGLSDLGKLKERAVEVRGTFVAIAACCALVSYAFIGACEGRLLAVLGHRVPSWTLFRATCVSVSANRSLRSGGATGFAVLAWILARFGVPTSAVLTATVGYSLISNALFAALFAALFVTGLALLALFPPQFEGDRAHVALVSYALAASAFVLLLLCVVAAFAWSRARRTWKQLVVAAVGRLGARAGRPEWGEHASAFLSRVGVAGRELLARRRSGAVGAAWLFGAARIAASIVALWACVQAAGFDVAPSVLILGYTAGKMAGVLSFVPGGLGIIEGSMAGVFTAFGVPYEGALLVALVNRATYHLVPAALGLAFLGTLPRRLGVPPTS